MYEELSPAATPAALLLSCPVPLPSPPSPTHPSCPPIALTPHHFAFYSFNFLFIDTVIFPSPPPPHINLTPRTPGHVFLVT